jgi:hypothetical protein
MDQTSNNVKATINGDKLILEIDLSKDLGKSKTGKSDLVASSRGYSAVDGADVQVSLNVIRK